MYRIRVFKSTSSVLITSSIEGGDYMHRLLVFRVDNSSLTILYSYLYVHMYSTVHTFLGASN
ncbi:hypothetical protein C0J52_07844 [Blattella germanica]|nr:hypothetical protein C0J52_07844 [Blattella germanica]